MEPYKDAVVSWPQTVDPVLGQLQAFELTVPWNLSGRLDIFAVPKCAESPEGYWYALNTGGNYQSAEPGCNAWEKTLLAQIRFFSAPTGQDDMDTNQPNTVEFAHAALRIDTAKLNPNDYSKKEGE